MQLGQQWKVAWRLVQVDVNFTAVFSVAKADSTTMLPQAAIYPLSHSMWKTSHCHSSKRLCWQWWWLQGGCMLTGLWADEVQTGLQGGWMTGHSPQAACWERERERNLYFQMFMSYKIFLHKNMSKMWQHNRVYFHLWIKQFIVLRISSHPAPQQIMFPPWCWTWGQGCQRHESVPRPVVTSSVTLKRLELFLDIPSSDPFPSLPTTTTVSAPFRVHEKLIQPCLVLNLSIRSCLSLCMNYLSLWGHLPFLSGTGSV